MAKMHRLYIEFGQSVWLDHLDRRLLAHGGLDALLAQGVRGVICDHGRLGQALASSGDYDEAIDSALQADPALDAEAVYQELLARDVRLAADILEPIYTRDEGIDGVVALPVSPRLAYDADATVAAARDLVKAVNRPNLAISVPATVPGLLALERLVAEGISVNATLVFSVDRYVAVSEAYLRGLARNPAPDKVASVASLFLSDVDARVDAVLEELDTGEARALRGRIAVANAKMAYQHFRETQASERFATEWERGARLQRLLWASTGATNPGYSDLHYVEQLIGPDTVSAMTPGTLSALQAHGGLRYSLAENVAAARQDLDDLEKLGVNLSAIMGELEQSSVRRLGDSYDRRLTGLENRVLARAATR